ncbi:unnamed protein product, partial [Scytosiphon promiscuus]
MTFLLLLLAQVVPRTRAERVRHSSPQIPHAFVGKSGRAAAGKKEWTLRQLDASANHASDRRPRPDRSISSGDSNLPDVGECILLFGAFCSGNMGDVIESMSMENLLASVAPDQCFWYAHPREEEGHGLSTNKEELSSHDVSSDALRLIRVTPDDANKVNRFKALVIGGGGIFASRHAPLHVSAFAQALTLPIIVLGVGASRHRAKTYATLAERAVFVSGRDAISTSVLAGVLRDSRDPVVQPDDVGLVHDPVLSDLTLTDTKGTCWKQSEGEYGQPLCFVLPASNTQASIEMHEHLAAHVVKPGDLFFNVLPTHQEDILRRHNYPGEVVQVSGLAEYTQRLCSCRAIVSARFHGVILGLHMGVPTFAAAPTARGGKVPGLVMDTMRLPEQLFVVDGKLSREAVDQEVAVVREMYASHGRRASIHARLSQLHDEFQVRARHVLFRIIGVPLRAEGPPQPGEQSEDFFSDAEIAKFLPAFSEGGDPAASDRYSVSASPPSSEGSGGPVGVLAGTTVMTKTAEGVSSITHHEKEAENEKGRRAERAETHVVKVATATGSTATASALHKETVEAVPDSRQENTEESPSLAKILLANREIFRRSAGHEEAPMSNGAELQPPIQKTPSAANRVSMVSTDKTEHSIAEVLISYSTVFVDKRESNGGKPAAAMKADVFSHRTTERTERIATVSDVSLPGKVSDTGSNTHIPAAEGASTNDAIETALIDDDCLVAVLLVAAVVGLALLPSGGAPRRASASHDDLVGKDAGFDSVRDAKSHAQRDGDSRTSSDSEVSVASKRSPSALPGHSTDASVRVVATSSKMIFMLNFAMWVSLYMGFSAYGKAYLLDTRDPIGLLVLQGATGVVVLCLIGRFGVLDLHPPKDLAPAAARQAGSAALLHTGHALAINFAVLMSGAAVGDATEATGPAAAAAFSYFLLGKIVTPSRMAALATIVAGMFMLTSEGNGSSGDGISGGGSGFVLSSAVVAVAAVCLDALRNVVIKKGNPVLPHQTLLACSAATAMIGAGLMLLRSGLFMLADLMKGVNASLCFVGYNLASFNLLVRLSPVGHAVGNACKRMLVFASGLLFLGEVMTVPQLGGTVIALFGVLAYNMAG